jgi:hypothetical protein
VIRFYDTADARGLDVDCFARMQPEAGGGAP